MIGAFQSMENSIATPLQQQQQNNQQWHRQSQAQHQLAHVGFALIVITNLIIKRVIKLALAAHFINAQPHQQAGHQQYKNQEQIA